MKSKYLKKQTLLRSINIKNFRNLSDIDVDFGRRITIISGKNGTAKSTILGLAAQIFSFDKDYTDNEKLDFITLSGSPFKSQFSEHFRLSKTYDKPGEMHITCHVFDAYLDAELDNLKLTMTNTSDRNHRMVVRNNKKTNHTNNSSRNVTHPVIYLSLKRLYPIAERKETAHDIDYLNNNAKDFITECNNIVGKNTGNAITSTKGNIISSSVVHGDNYDNQSVSSGEDNVGQIVQALFSFKKLSEEYPNYHGGLLIIDELDAGLFPYAQSRMIDVLQNYAKTYNIQIIASTHSPIIIEKVFEKSKNNTSKEFKNIFLTDAYGKLQIKTDYRWADIFADLMIDTIKLPNNIQLPKVNVYCEDGEAFGFLGRLITNRKIKKVVNFVHDVSLGAGSFKKLTDQKIPEFTTKSIIVLDGDAYPGTNQSPHKNTLLLPTTQPPDRLAFKHLFALPTSDLYWDNSIRFTKTVFNSITAVSRIISRLELDDTNIADFDTIVQAELNDPNTSNLRSLFKEFYKNYKFQDILKSVKTNPFEHFLQQNPRYKLDFEQEFIKALKYVLQYGHGVPKSTLESYFN